MSKDLIIDAIVRSRHSTEPSNTVTCAKAEAVVLGPQSQEDPRLR